MQIGLLTYLSFIFILLSSPSIETKIFPQETDDVLVNPHMGWVMEERLRDVEVVMGSTTPNDGDWGLKKIKI